MKIFNKIKIAGLALAACLALTLSVHATGYRESFQATNYLGNAVAGSTNITSWPTNALTTNGIGQLTGHAVGIYNQDHIGFVFEGYLSNTTASVIGVTLLTSMAPGGSGASPNAFVGTSAAYTGGNLLGATVGGLVINDWPYYTSTTAATIPQFNIQVPALTNWFHWETNFASTTVIGDANWVGIGTITNNFTSGNGITNANNSLFSVNKKLIPKPLIAQ